MGFSLATFLWDLKDLLESDVEAVEKVRLLAVLVEDAHAYAKKCGEL